MSQSFLYCNSSNHKKNSCTRRQTSLTIILFFFAIRKLTFSNWQFFTFSALNFEKFRTANSHFIERQKIFRKITEITQKVSEQACLFVIVWRWAASWVLNFVAEVQNTQWQKFLLKYSYSLQMQFVGLPPF